MLLFPLNKWKFFSIVSRETVYKVCKNTQLPFVFCSDIIS